MWALLRALSYLAITGGCVGALYAGGVYLTAPDGTGPVARAPAPIPPRLAESIERKVPVPPRVAPAAAPLPPAPAMWQASAALPIVAAAPPRGAVATHKPHKPIGARRAEKPGAPRPNLLATQNDQVQEYRATGAVTTARSDVPY